MKRTCILVAAGLAAAASSMAQSLLDQQVQTLDAGARNVVIRPIGQRAETGKPFSATIVNRTDETYLDGTHVSRTTTMVQYRDSDGRMRNETTTPDKGGPEIRTVIIRDPVAGVAYQLDVGSKTATKLAMAGMPPAGGRGGGRGSDVPQTRSADTAVEIAKRNPNDIVEELGTMTVNGVPARGVRITNVVPAGAIGNDREFRSVSERWFSPDLNLLIKSVTTDPRFGTTVHELTNISRLPPDPQLFLVPPDYKIVSNGPREPQF